MICGHSDKVDLQVWIKIAWLSLGDYGTPPHPVDGWGIPSEPGGDCVGSDSPEFGEPLPILDSLLFGSLGTPGGGLGSGGGTA